MDEPVGYSKFVYVVMYDEPDEPWYCYTGGRADVLAAFTTKEAAEAYVDGSDTCVVIPCTLSET